MNKIKKIWATAVLFPLGTVTAFAQSGVNGLNAAVYTQITDVENECNGLMTYDRYLKPNLSLINGSNKKAIAAKMLRSNVIAIFAQHSTRPEGRTILSRLIGRVIGEFFWRARCSGVNF